MARQFDPRTIALLRAAVERQREGAVDGDVDRAAPQRPLALIPVHALPASPAQPAQPAPVATPAPRASRATSDVPRGATPLLPGFTSALKPAARAPKKSLRDGVFDKVSQPDAPLTDVVIFDTETTGTGPDARVVELGALRVRDGKIVERFQTLLDPEQHIPAYVTRIHGITDAMVKSQPRARHVLPAFWEFVGDRPLLAHNASFDRRMMLQEVARLGLRAPGIPLFCSLKLARRVFPQAPNHGLGTLARYLQIPDPPAHRAIADCLTTAGLLAACAARHPLRTLHVVHGGVASL